MLFIVDPVAEYGVQRMKEFNGIKLTWVAKEGLDVTNEDEISKEKLMRLPSKDLKTRLAWMGAERSGCAAKSELADRLMRAMKEKIGVSC